MKLYNINYEFKFTPEEERLLDLLEERDLEAFEILESKKYRVEWHGNICFCYTTSPSGVEKFRQDMNKLFERAERLLGYIRFKATLSIALEPSDIPADADFQRVVNTKLNKAGFLIESIDEVEFK